MPLVPGPKPFESNKGSDGASVGWEATPVWVVTVTWLSCNGQSPRSCGPRQPRGPWWRREGAGPPCAPLPAPSQQPGPRGRRKENQEAPPPPMALGACCGPMSRRCECGGAQRADGLPWPGCLSTGPLREPGGCVCTVRGTVNATKQSKWQVGAGRPGPRHGVSGLGRLAFPLSLGTGAQGDPAYPSRGSSLRTWTRTPH